MSINYNLICYVSFIFFVVSINLKVAASAADPFRIVFAERGTSHGKRSRDFRVDYVSYSGAVEAARMLVQAAATAARAAQAAAARLSYVLGLLRPSV